MSNSQDNTTSKTLLKTLLPASILGGVSIGLFVLIYLLLESSVAPFPRLITALCAPPAIIAIIVGFYMLFGSRRNQSS